MAVVAVIMALPLRRAVVQRLGRDWVATQKGRVTFSHKYNAATDKWDNRSTLLAPDWLVRALGIDFFDSVDTVVLDNSEVKDLSPITDLQSLRYLAGITGAGITGGITGTHVFFVSLPACLTEFKRTRKISARKLALVLLQTTNLAEIRTSQEPRRRLWTVV
jgi:hypothetical protein